MMFRMKLWWKTTMNRLRFKDFFWLGLMVIFGLLLLRYQLKLIHYIVWYDESETIVATKMMVAGKQLYTEIFNNHGPATFIIGYVISALGDFSTQVYRIPMVILQWLALAALYMSPIQSSSTFKRLTSVVVVATFWMLFLPFIYGHAYLYQTQSGLFFVIILAQYALPIYLDKPLNRFQQFIGPFLLSFVPFFAITNVPMVALIVLSTLRRKDGWVPWIGYALGGLINLIFLVAIGSIDGYFAYHVYLNAVILNEGNGLAGYIRNVIIYYRENFSNFLTLVILMMATYGVTKKAQGFAILRAIMLVPMFMSLVIRGGKAYDLWGLIYLYSLSGLTLVFFMDDENTGSWINRLKDWPFALLILLGFYSVVRTSFIDQNMALMPSSTPFSRIVQRVTEPTDEILAFTYRNYEYLVSDRLPASAHFYYLPMQAQYNKNPYKDIKTDLLSDMMKAKPKLLVMDFWSSTEVPWDTYASDIVRYVLANYNQIGYTDMYVRKDIDLTKFGVDPNTGDIIQ